VMPPARWVGFSLVWAALVLFSVDSLRAARSGASAPPTPPPVTADGVATTTGH